MKKAANAVINLALLPTPYSLLPTPYSLLPTPYSLLPTPYSLLPTPYSLLPTPYSLLPTPINPDSLLLGKPPNSIPILWHPLSHQLINSLHI
ncbi:hypothetical protein BJP36_39005 [Moorena producens JHB]|uniref:Uncharacterized protein n=1 Tax=Moorena producens (strain JHB) TaxID=1454205 RepID=A0A9Q9UWM7_MOOP1|nr:hypothetical protein [Moorena producens]WAN70056.1 hypothetical protein BJP36_39005 [Moorena producens JHB]